MSDNMDRPTTEYRGVKLILMRDTFGDKGDQWAPWEVDSPIRGGSMQECMDQIDKWEIEKQKQAGMRLWVVEHDNPKYWSMRDAVYRATDGNTYSPTKIVQFRNGSDPDRLYGRPCGDCAMPTPEVETAIEAARLAYDELIAANDRWKLARRAIPRMTAAEWAELPERDTQ